MMTPMLPPECPRNMFVSRGLDQEHMVCCCRASGWAKAIAWLQMILCTIGTIAAFISVAENLAGKDTSERWSIAKELVLLITYIMGAVMGYLLLKGSQLAKAEYLDIWTGYAVLAGIVHVVAFLGSLITSDGWLVFGAWTVPYILVTSVCIGLVRVHAKDIREGIVNEAITEV